MSSATRQLMQNARLTLKAKEAKQLGWTNVKIVGTGKNAFVRGSRPGCRHLSRFFPMPRKGSADNAQNLS